MPLILLVLTASLVLLPGRAEAVTAEGAGENDLASYLAGVVAERRGDTAAAADYITDALSRDPDNQALMLKAFTLNAGAGRLDRAVDLAWQLKGRGSNDSSVLLVLAADALLRDEPGEARDLLSRMPAMGITSLTRPLLDAWLAAAEGKAEEALGGLRELEQEAALDPLLALHRMLLLDVLGRQQEAAAAAIRIVEEAGEPSLRLVQHVGNLLARVGRIDDAGELYADFIARNPGTAMLGEAPERLEAGEVPDPLVPDASEGFAQALFDFASLMAQEQAWAPSLVHAYTALHISPGLVPATILVGEILQYQERHAEAVAVYETIPADSPFSWNGGLRIAEELERLGEVEKAADKLRELTEQRPERYEPLYRLGNLLRNQEDFEEAEEAYSKAIERVGEETRQHWILYYFRGITFERTDRWDQAEADFKKALELEPDQPYVLNYLAYSWIEQERNLEEAESMLLKAVEREPEDGQIVDSLGWAYYRLGRYEEAVVRLERAVELMPQDPVINDHLGDAYWRTGRKREAEVQWHRALSLDPEEDEIPVIEQKLREGLSLKAERS